MRFRLTLEYDGANYAGWQLQAGQDSIQARLEAALAELFGAPIRVYGAGRTDAGVHASGQVAAFDAPREIKPENLRRALNALLPLDIAIREAAATSEDFDPRRSAVARTYEYHVLNRETRSAFDYRHGWLVREPLDLAAMNIAAAALIGEHDFAAFRTLGSDERTTTRRIYASAWRAEADGRLIYRVEATAFLRHMVRTMVALMVEIGRGKLPPGAAASILSSRDRAQAPGAAPARGLFLVEVRY
ncbi:MAG TPA: tRNA pseudouridine(38-40) synthase TruA [Candidatus Binataceae bacterium]|nr:tRNA pseudouridine(38-40) synthase TruA [Candidatus Binataceae bacterium]